MKRVDNKRVFRGIVFYVIPACPESFFAFRRIPDAPPPVDCENDNSMRLRRYPIIANQSAGPHFLRNVVIYTNMRKMVFLIFLLVFPAIAYAQPSISFDSESYDFGTIPQGKAIEHTFEVSNAGTAELVIQKVIPS